MNKIKISVDGFNGTKEGSEEELVNWKPYQ